MFKKIQGAQILILFFVKLAKEYADNFILLGLFLNMQCMTIIRGGHSTLFPAFALMASDQIVSADAQTPLSPPSPKKTGRIPNLA